MFSLATFLGRLLGITVLLTMNAAFAATVTVSPGSDSVPIPAATRTFSASVAGLSDTTVTWSVNGIPGGNIATVGAIDATGKYTSPNAIPATNPVTIAATASDGTSTGSATVTLRLPRPQITSATITPGTPNNYSVVVKGSRFYPQVWATLNGQPLTLQYQSATQVTLAVASPPQGQDNLVLWNASNADSSVFKVCFAGCYTSTPTPAAPPFQPAPPANPQDISAARFLEQASFGPDAASLALVKQIGIDAWISQQFAMAETAYADGLITNQMGPAWFGNMAAAPDQLRQRVMFALSQIFVVSTTKNVADPELLPWVRLLSKNALRAPTNAAPPFNSPFYNLLREVTLSPVMGKYLDLANSQAPAGAQNAANENYAREVLQLFTIGLVQLNQDGSPITDAQNQPLPTYDQTTIQQLALALTGWTYPTPAGKTPGSTNWENFTGPMEPLDQYHDKHAKTLFPGTPGAATLPAGLGAAAELDRALTAIFNHPNVAPFIATRLIRSLVTSNPSPAYIQAVAAVFADNGSGVRGDMQAVIRAILTHPEARQDTPTADQGRLKDPVLHMLGFTRAMGASLVDPALFQWELLLIGQKVLEPPSVFSYYSPLYRLPGGAGKYGPEFQIYTPSQSILRANLFWELLSGATGGAYVFNLAPYTAVATDPNALLNLINANLFQGRMSPEMRQVLYDTAVPYTDLTQRARTLIYLAVISSEFAIHR